jgi:hypothetical protein
MKQDEGEIDREVLEEGCYYLSELGLPVTRIAAEFGVSTAKVRSMIRSYSRKLRDGRITPGSFDRTFWEDVKKEAEGDVKLTFVSEKGFHHAWKSELRKLDGPALMSIFESSKRFLDMDPNRRFLDFPVPAGYDPLALQREVKRAIEVISSLLKEKWEGEEEEKEKESG